MFLIFKASFLIPLKLKALKGFIFDFKQIKKETINSIKDKIRILFSWKKENKDKISQFKTISAKNAIKKMNKLLKIAQVK